MFSSDKWFGASAGFYPVTIDQSLRFDGSSSYLTKTPSSDGNRRKWTFSAWIKFSQTDDLPSIFGKTRTGNNREGFAIGSSQKLQYQLRVGSTTKALVESEMVLRDLTNFYHIMMIWDSDNATASNRVIFYVNGQNAGLEITTTPVQYTDSYINSTNQNYIGWTTGGSNYLHGYMAEVNFVDGQALTPSSFGETKSGIWVPKEISGLTYGTNGFRLTFADSSSLGDDTSGNGNDYTSSGLASTDVVSDSPTNNFATLNNLQQRSNSLASFSEGNLKVNGTSASASGIMTGTFGVSSGKWYWEVRATDSATFTNLGVCFTPFFTAGTADTGYYSNEYVYVYTGVKNNNASSSAYGASYTTGDIIGVALDLDADTITFYKNGSSQGVAYSSLPSGTYLPVFDCYNGSGWILNAGQEGTFVGNETAGGNSDANGVGNFKYTVPSGHLALCSANLPDTTISPNQSTQADDHFITTTYSGDSNNSTQISTGFQPDWVWIKNRTEGSSDGSGEHMLYDSSRGVHDDLNSNNTSAEDTNTNGLQEFGSTFFRPGSLTRTNETGDTYVAWNWKANGGTTSSNTDGTITSTVQANTTAGFSIVTYTGTGSSGTIGHGLVGTAPDIVITKSRSATGKWFFFTTAEPTKYNYLNQPSAFTTSNLDDRFGNNTSVILPSSTVVTIGTNADVNTSGTTYVSYVFAEVEGYSKFGSYTGNGSTDGTFVYTGFRPAWIMFKASSASGENWYILDNKRDVDNVVGQYLYANTSGAESDLSSSYPLDFLSNGFKIRNATYPNTSGRTYIYMAFAEQPFKFSNAR